MKKNLMKSLALTLAVTTLLSTTALATSLSDYTQYDVGSAITGYQSFSDGIAVFSDESKAWFIDQEGNQLFGTTYEYASQFCGGYAAVGNDGVYWHIDTNGEKIYSETFDYTGRFINGYSTVSSNGEYYHIDENGDAIYTERFAYVDDFYDGYAVASTGFGYVFIDENGDYMTGSIYQNVIPFSNGVAIVLSYWGDVDIIDTTGASVLDGDFEIYAVFDLTEGYTALTTQDGDGLYIDNQGNVVFSQALKYRGYLYSFSEGLCAATFTGNALGFMNTEGEMVIPEQFYECEDFLDGYAICYNSDWQTCIIDTQGNFILDYVDTYLWNIGEGNFLCETASGYALFNVNTAETTTVEVPATTVATTATATPSATNLMVNGEAVDVDAYLIDGNNYIKLRDLASMVNGTEKNFEVTWNETMGAIEMLSGKAYTSVGGEMTQGTGETLTATVSTATIYCDGTLVELTAYTINDNNYFKLRDIMELFDISVGYDETTATLDTTASY